MTTAPSRQSTNARLSLGEIPIEIAVPGGTEARTRESFHSALAGLTTESRRRPLFVRGSLDHDRNPAVALPVHADAVVDFGGDSVRAHAAARTSAQAIALVVHRLRRNLREESGRRLERRRQGPPDAGPK